MKAGIIVFDALYGKRVIGGDLWSRKPRRYIEGVGCWIVRRGRGSALVPPHCKRSTAIGVAANTSSLNHRHVLRDFALRQLFLRGFPRPNARVRRGRGDPR